MGVVKSIYRLSTSSNSWHAHLLHTLSEMSFKPTRFDLDVCIMGNNGGYDNIGTHTNYVLVIAVNPNSIFNNLKCADSIKDFILTKVHLGCD